MAVGNKCKYILCLITPIRQNYLVSKHELVSVIGYQSVSTMGYELAGQKWQKWRPCMPLTKADLFTVAIKYPGCQQQSPKMRLQHGTIPRTPTGHWIY